MAIFGRKTARQRLRRASQQALSVPAFRASMDCTPWVLGGLWPSDLQQVNSETAPLAEYLKKDLQRIADSANDRLRAISEAGLDESVRQAEETRVINVARAFAVLRVESTVRQLRREPLGFQPEKLGLTARTAPAAERANPEPERAAPEPRPEPRREPEPRRQPEPEPAPAPTVVSGRHRIDRPDRDGFESPPGWPAAPRIIDADDVDADDVPAAPVIEVVDTAEVVEPEVIDAEPSEPIRPAIEVIEPRATRAVPVAEPPPTRAPEPEPTPEPVAPGSALTAEPDGQLLQRLVRFVARQEPGLRWAAGSTKRGGVLLTTDLAHGWIPPGIKLPAGVELLEPERRTGSPVAMLGDVDPTATYAPGNSFGGFVDRDKVEVSAEPRRLEPIDDLDQKISDATRQRDGLPRLTHSLASTAASGAVVIDAEVDVLRVHLDTARYQLLAQYPDVDNGLLLNCLLLAATEALVTGDRTAANYHFAWFGVLSGPPTARWGSEG